MKHKLMEVMRVREDARELDGRVEIDDTYLGGKRHRDCVLRTLPQPSSISFFVAR